MRDPITNETYGAGYCLHGEPTGDETPINYDAGPDDYFKACRVCGEDTPYASRVCFDCTYGTPCASCGGAGEAERDAPGTLYGVTVTRCAACAGTGYASPHRLAA